MVSGNPTDFRAEIEAALGWWRLAGLSNDATDEANVWLDAETRADPPSDAKGKPASSTSKQTENRQRPSGAQRIAVQDELHALPAPENWPKELDAFQAWWANGFAETGTPSVPAPRGDANAATLFLVGQPEEADRAFLLAGRKGQMLAAIERAMGLAPENSYFASVLPRHTIQPDWTALAEGRMALLLRHHLALAVPRRIIVFGRRILPLLAHGAAQPPADLREFNHEGSSVPVMAAPDLGTLLRSAGQRRRFWHDWIEWTGDT